MAGVGLYLHIPFCRHRCAYCDFNTYAGMDDLIPEYVEALCAEAEFVTAYFEQPLPVETIFFGGGTPSLLRPTDLDKILDRLFKRFVVRPNAEITLEANPGTIDLAYLREIYALGINRLSLGMQSANQFELSLLWREHNWLDVLNSVSWARRAGFENINLDLMFGLPDQAIKTWLRSLHQAIALQPTHFSLYALTLEHGTPMHAWVSRGLMSEPDSDLAAEMYELAGEMMEKNGYNQYEISNWAIRENSKGILSCRHNLIYWRNLSYIGLGAGAHGYANEMRVANVLSPNQYIKRLTKNDTTFREAASPRNREYPWTPATASIIRIDRQTEMAETMLMGLRLTEEGVAKSTFYERFGVSLTDVFAPQLGSMLKRGLLEWQGEVVRLTPRGRLLGNQVFLQFV